MEWVEQRPATPEKEGWYRVAHAGDSESVDGHKIYEFSDYEDWAFWAPAHPNEREDFEGGFKGRWEFMHDEVAEFVFAYCGPFEFTPFADWKRAQK